MKISELKRIAKENEYELTKSFGHYKLVRRIKSGNHYITIGNVLKNKLWISIEDYCYEKDFNMMKAAVAFAETPPEDREEEKKFYLEHKWENKKFTRKEIEEIKEKFDISWKDFAVVEEKDKGNWPNWMTRCLGEPFRDCEVEVEK